MYQEAHAIIEKALGFNHSSMAIILNNIAIMNISNCDFHSISFDESVELLEKSKSIVMSTLGAKNPLVNTIQLNIENAVKSDFTGSFYFLF